MIYLRFNPPDGFSSTIAAGFAPKLISQRVPLSILLVRLHSPFSTHTHAAPTQSPLRTFFSSPHFQSLFNKLPPPFSVRVQSISVTSTPREAAWEGGKKKNSIPSTRSLQYILQSIVQYIVEFYLVIYLVIYRVIVSGIFPRLCGLARGLDSFLIAPTSSGRVGLASQPFPPEALRCGSVLRTAIRSSATGPPTHTHQWVGRRRAALFYPSGEMCMCRLLGPPCPQNPWLGGCLRGLNSANWEKSAP